MNLRRRETRVPPRRLEPGVASRASVVLRLGGRQPFEGRAMGERGVVTVVPDAAA